MSQEKRDPILVKIPGKYPGTLQTTLSFSFRTAKMLGVLLFVGVIFIAGSFLHLSGQNRTLSETIVTYEEIKEENTRLRNERNAVQREITEMEEHLENIEENLRNIRKLDQVLSVVAEKSAARD